MCIRDSRYTYLKTCCNCRLLVPSSRTRSPRLDGLRTALPTPSSATSLLLLASPRLLPNSERCAQGHTAVSRAQSLQGLLLLILLPDIVLGDREEAHDFLKDAFQPPYGCNESAERRAGPRAGDRPSSRGGGEDCKEYLSSTLWVGDWSTVSRPQER